MKNTALVLIDIQNIYFTEGPMLLYKPEEAANKAKVILDYFRRNNKPVIHVKHAFNMQEYENKQEYVNEIHTSVTPITGEQVIMKHCPNSFLGTDLHENLKKLGVTNLVIVGMMSHMCVDTTVRACQDYGYHVTLIDDACTTMNLTYKTETLPAELVHKVYMASVNGAFAKVVNSDDFLREDC